MNKTDFKNILNNGFRIDYQGSDSDARCFECGEVSELKKVNKKWKMKCKNNHKYNLIDWLVKHIDMRDGVAKVILRGECSFAKVRED